MPPTFSTLTHLLRRTNGRFRQQQSLDWGPRGLLAGLLLAAVVATAARFWPLLTNGELAWVALGLAGLGLLVGLLAVWLPRPSLLVQARRADQLLQLQERAQTAVELHHHTITAPDWLIAQQLADAVAALQTIDLSAMLPLTLRRRDWLVLLLTAGLLLTAVLLPNPQTTALLRQRAIAQTIAEETAVLEEVAEEIRQDDTLTAEQQEQLLQPVQTALDALASSGSQEEAVAALSQAETELRELSSELAPPNLQPALEAASETLSNNPAAEPLAEALQNGNLNQASAATSQLAADLPTFNEETVAQLAEALAETAQSLQTSDQQLADAAQEAANALSGEDLAAAQEALQNLAQQLQERGAQTAVSQQAAATANQLGESRQAVAQAGQKQPEEGGETAVGEAPNQQNQGEGTGAGLGGGQSGSAGQSGGEAGSTAELSENLGSGGGSPGPGGSHAATVYVPPPVDLSNIDGQNVELPAECLANPADCGGLLNETPTEFGSETSLVPYTDVFGDYRNAANEALQDDYIPLGLKAYVRDYFSSLEP
ncbi:MAG: hypothetical protein H6668_08170 [Ardenticatenaceae bacterium]|nr:hypothetical protein [Ardenticatenaceae bacterium]